MLLEWKLKRVKGQEDWKKEHWQKAHGNKKEKKVLGSKYLKSKVSTAFQIFSLSIHWNSHPARQCFVCHGNNWINGKTGGIELPITNFIYNFLTQ